MKVYVYGIEADQGIETIAIYGTFENAKTAAYEYHKVGAVGEYLVGYVIKHECDSGSLNWDNWLMKIGGQRDEDEEEDDE